jgi:hypothetical protein
MSASSVFDIRRPLQKADISATTKQLQPALRRLNVVFWLALVVFSASLTVILALIIGSQNTGAALTLALAFFAAALGFFVWSTHSYEACRKTFASMAPVTLLELSNIERCLDQSPLCAYYLKAVSEQGRPICALELKGLEAQMAKDIAAAETVSVRESFAQRGIALC